MNKNLLALLLFCFTISCIGFKKSAQRSRNKAYEEFFIGNNSFQYFIKPIRLNGENGYIEFDCTFKKIGENFSDVTINYTIVDNLCRKLNLKDITFKSYSGSVFVLYPKELFYLEEYKKYCVIRQSAVVNFNDFHSIFCNLYSIENSENTFFLKGKERDKKKYTIEELFKPGNF